MAVLTRLFELMAQKRTSDLFVSAGAPIHIKINGNTVPVNSQSMSPDDTKKICYEILKPHQIERFEKELELNFSMPIDGVGNFRVNMMWQKGSCAAVIRYIETNIPEFRSLALPQVLAQVVMALVRI